MGPIFGDKSPMAFSPGPYASTDLSRNLCVPWHDHWALWISLFGSRSCTGKGMVGGGHGLHWQNFRSVRMVLAAYGGTLAFVNLCINFDQRHYLVDPLCDLSL